MIERATLTNSAFHILSGVVTFWCARYIYRMVQFGTFCLWCQDLRFTFDVIVTDICNKKCLTLHNYHLFNMHFQAQLNQKLNLIV
jgi:hypothetical protein